MCVLRFFERLPLKILMSIFPPQQKRLPNNFALLDSQPRGMWFCLGLNQGPPDYESGATNQLSYRTILVCNIFTVYPRYTRNIFIMY